MRHLMCPGPSAGVEIVRVSVVEEPSHPFQFGTLIDRLRRRVATLIEADFDHLHLGQRSFIKHGVRGVNRHSWCRAIATASLTRADTRTSGLITSSA